ncbi:DUF3102 domain-containing protein [Anaerovorax odorimutans]|nr:DUF3102 domain-containing protein [Anaerovorax odorimutans]
MENIINADYQVIQDRTPAVIRTEIKTIEAQVYKTTLDGVIQIGTRLQEVKEMLGHGNWLSWCKENLGYSDRQAQRYIEISQEYGKENSAYLNTTISSDLSISKAYSLLSLPENEVEKFAEENDIENMTVKKLESEIKEWKNRAASLDAYLEDIKEDHAKLQAQKEEKEAALAEKNEIIAHLDDELELMKEKQDDPEKIALLEKQLTEERNAAEKAKEELEKEKEATEAKIQAAITEKEAALREEAEEAQAEKLKAAEESKRAMEEQLAKAEKKLKLSNNEDVTLIKLHLDTIQKSFIAVDVALDNVGLADKEQEAKLKAAAKKILQGMIDKLEG